MQLWVSLQDIAKLILNHNKHTVKHEPCAYILKYTIRNVLPNHKPILLVPLGLTKYKAASTVAYSDEFEIRDWPLGFKMVARFRPKYQICHDGYPCSWASIWHQIGIEPHYSIRKLASKLFCLFSSLSSAFQCISQGMWVVFLSSKAIYRWAFAGCYGSCWAQITFVLSAWS